MITHQNQQSHSVREFMRGGRKHVELTKLSAQLPANMRMFNVLTLIPGASIGYHVHEGETELFYFLEGNSLPETIGIFLLAVQQTAAGKHACCHEQ